MSLTWLLFGSLGACLLTASVALLLGRRANVLGLKNQHAIEELRTEVREDFAEVHSEIETLRRTTTPAPAVEARLSERTEAHPETRERALLLQRQGQTVSGIAATLGLRRVEAEFLVKLNDRLQSEQ